MRVSVHYYAAAKELAGCESSTFEFAGEIVPQADLRSAVIELARPLLSELGTLRAV